MKFSTKQHQPSGRIEMLCCLAGLGDCTAPISTIPADFSKVIDVNLMGSFLGAQAAARHIIASKAGVAIILWPRFLHIMSTTRNFKQRIMSAKSSYPTFSATVRQNQLSLESTSIAFVLDTWTRS